MGNVVFSVRYDVMGFNPYAQFLEKKLRDYGLCVYNPNRHDKQFCGEECSVARYGCCKYPFDPARKPTDQDCWQSSYRWHLEYAEEWGIHGKRIVMLCIQLGEELGPGQKTEKRMAESLNIERLVVKAPFANEETDFFKAYPQVVQDVKAQLCMFFGLEASVDLRSWNVKKLKNRAIEVGASQEQIEQCEDEDDYKEALISLIENIQASVDLRSLNVRQLKNRAMEVGASQEQIEQCKDEDDYKETLIGLIENIQAHEESTENVITMSKRLDEAMQKEDLSEVFRLFVHMADSRDKNAFKVGGLMAKAQNAWSKLSDKLCMRFIQDHQEKMATVKSRRDENSICVLAACPEIGLDGTPVQAIAAWAVRQCGGWNLTGNAGDTFHKLLMDERYMSDVIPGWRIAWQGKLEGILEASRSKRSLVLYSLKGGPETDWEQEYLLGPFKEVHSQKRNIEFVCLKDVDELLKHLECSTI